MNNQPEISFKQTTLIVVWLYQILSVFLIAGWLLITLLPNAMSFDAGIHLKTILMDVALTFGPIALMVVSNWFCWHSYRKDRYAAALSMMIVMVVLVAVSVLRLLY